MEIALRSDLSTFGVDDVRTTVRSALEHELALARARCSAYERACREFELRYQLSSDRFLEQFEAGMLGDDADYFDWFAAKRGLDLWDRL